jgi:hypothetical protein
LTRLRALPRGTILLAVAIVAVFAAAASNISETVTQGDARRRDRDAFVDWAVRNGGRRAYGVAIPEHHARYDVVCAPHFAGAHTRRRADYRIYLVVDSHGHGRPRIVRVARGPVKVKPTATGPKCGNPPPP